MKTYSMAELMKLTSLSPRTVRNYIAQGLIPKPTLAGSATRYPRQTLGKLVAIRSWGQNDKVAMSTIAAALEEYGDGEWEAWASRADPIAPPPAPVPPVAAPPPKAFGAAAAPADLELGETWVHVPLIPGLVLMMRAGASEMTARTAREIQKRYRAG